MKKTLVALAVLGSFAGVASAATSVTLYGTVDGGYEDWQFKNGLKKLGIDQPGGFLKNKLQQGGYSESNSKFGIKGQEDLGNGLAAIFTLEGRFGADDGDIAATDRFFHRESTVGLKGSFGEVKIGRARSQMELALGGIVPGSRVADVDLYSVALTRHSNGLFYSYDNAGFSFGADVTTKGGAAGNATDEEGAKDSKIGYGARLGYAGQVGGGVTLLARAAYQNDGTTATLINGDTVKNQEWGGLLAAVVPYANNALTVGVAYAQGKGEAADLVAAKFGTDRVATKKARTLSGVIASSFGANDSAYVKYQQRKGTTAGATDYKGDVWAVGYAHSLSKRTSVYADVAYARIKTISGTAMDQAVGTRGAPTSNISGKAIGYSVGVAHNF